MKKAFLVVAAAVVLGLVGLGAYRISNGQCPLSGKCLHSEEGSLTQPACSEAAGVETPAPVARAGGVSGQ